MSEEKPQLTAQQIFMEILKEERAQTEMLRTIHFVARFQQIVIAIALVVGIIALGVWLLSAFIR